MPGTGLSKNLISPIAIARVFGESINADRIQLFKSFYESLTKIEDPNYTDGNGNIKSYRNFSFFEGYFSNCIEGTESTGSMDKHSRCFLQPPQLGSYINHHHQ